MNVASLDLCKELYELSGWETDQTTYYSNDLGIIDAAATEPDGETYLYDSGFLLRKLPGKYYTKRTGAYLRMSADGNTFMFAYMTADLIYSYRKVAETPEDALAKLCIELINQGILPGRK